MLKNRHFWITTTLFLAAALLFITPEMGGAEMMVQDPIPVDIDQTENELVRIARGLFEVLQIVAIFAAIGFGLWQMMQAARQRNAADGAKALVLFVLAGFAYSPSTWVRAVGMNDLATQIERVIPARAESDEPAAGVVTPDSIPSPQHANGRYILTLRSTDGRTVECVGAIEPSETLIFHCRENLKILEEYQQVLPDTIWLSVTDQGRVIRQR